MSVVGSRPGNPFGIAEALGGLATGFLISLVAVSAYDSLEHLPTDTSTTPVTVISLVGLWIGFVGAAVLATRFRAGPGVRGSGSIVADYGLRFRPWPDLPLGLAVGIGSQFLLVPLLELPLVPFVPHLRQQLGHPTHELLGPATSAGTAGLVLVAVLVCVGSPLVEELFFRGLVLRSLLWRLSGLGPRLGPSLAIVVTGLFFGLVHFETLQFLALSGFGMVLGVLAWRTGRLGPGIVAHLAFNTSTVIAFVFVHHHS